MKGKKAVGFVVIGLVAGLVLGSIGIATAASTNTTTSAGATSTASPQGFDGRGPGGGHGGVIGKPGFGGEGDIAEALAKLSGLTVDEINTKRAAGTSYAAIAKAEGVSTDKLVDATVEIESDELDAAVKAGTITSDEKATVLKDIESRVKTAIESTGAMRGPGGPGSPGGGHRGPGGPQGMAPGTQGTAPNGTSSSTGTSSGTSS